MSETDSPPPAQAFAFVGDSNIKNNVNKTNCRAHPNMKSAQVLVCSSLETFADTLRQVKTASDVCVVSCLTTFLIAADGPSTVSHRVEPVLQEVRGLLLEICFDNPNRHYMISPPMYRTSPVWYREGLAEILTVFSGTLSSDRPPNLHLLPSFPTPDFESDGLLTAYSGLEFILHLFDSTHLLLANLESAPETGIIRNSESTRVLEDRVMAIEQDHRRLNRFVEHKTAIDAELADFLANERFEDSFVIFGLDPIPSDLVGKAWQDRAVKDVQGVLTTLMGREYTIVFVRNATSRAKDAEVSYNVQLTSVAESSQIRKKFGTFFHGGKDGRPDSLKPYNIKNLVTRETRTRIDVLKLLAKRYKDSNPGGRAQVISYDARPLIKITPPADASDRRIKTFNYVEAVRTLPCNFSSAEVAPIIRRIDPKHAGQVRALFVVLSDDQFRQELRRFSFKPKAAEGGNPEVAPVVPQPTGSGSSSGSNPVHQSKSGRNHKRGAATALGNSAKK